MRLWWVVKKLWSGGEEFAGVGGLGIGEELVLTSTLSYLKALILFAINLKPHTTAFAFMKLCRCFYLVFTTVVDLFVFA